MILLIDNYDSFTYNLFHYLGQLGADVVVKRNDELSAGDALALRPDAIVLSPGPCTPNEAGICMALIAEARGQVPLLGVCLGHQAIGQVYGGRIVRAGERLFHDLSDFYERDRGGRQANAVFRRLSVGLL